MTTILAWIILLCTTALLASAVWLALRNWHHTDPSESIGEQMEEAIEEELPRSHPLWPVAMFGVYMSPVLAVLVILDPNC